MPATISGRGAEIKMFRDQALLSMLLLVTLFCVHTLSGTIQKFLCPFVLSMVIIAIVEQPAEWLFLLISGRLRCRAGCEKLVRRLKAFFTTGHLSGAATPEDEEPPEDALAEETPILGWRGRRPQLASTTDSVARVFTVFFTLALMVLLLGLLSLCIFQAVTTIKEDWPIYKAGAEEVFSGLSDSANSVVNSLNTMTNGTVLGPPGTYDNSTNGTSGNLTIDQLLKNGNKQLLNSIEGFVVGLVQGLASGVTTGFMFFVQVILYMFFWLLDPLPVGGRAAKLVRSYIRKKFVVCLGYSLSVLILLIFTKVKLKAFIVCFSFFLSFIPEIGSMIAALLPVPVIIFDSQLASPGTTLVVVLGFELFFRTFWGNFVEVRLVQHDEELKIHAVWIIFGLMYFGFSFGPLGMLVSVPIIALVKASAMDRALGIPAHIADPFIACIEGRRHRGRAKEDPDADVEEEAATTAIP